MIGGQRDEQRERRDGVEQRAEREQHAPRPPVAVREPADRDRDHEAQYDRGHRQCQVHEHELPDQVEVRPEPVHGARTPAGRPSASTTTLPAVDVGQVQGALAAVGPDEVRDELVGRVREDLGRRRGLRDLAAALHDHDLVAEQERLVDVVGHEHDGLAELALQRAAAPAAARRARSGRPRRTARPSAGCSGRPRVRGRRRRAAAGRPRAGWGTGRRASGRVRRCRAARARARTPRACGVPRSSGTVATLSITVRCGSRPEFCMT